MDFLGKGQRVVVLRRETMTIRENGATVSGSEYADVLDFEDVLITRFLVIQDLSAVVYAYRSECIPSPSAYAERYAPLPGPGSGAEERERARIAAQVPGQRGLGGKLPAEQDRGSCTGDPLAV